MVNSLIMVGRSNKEGLISILGKPVISYVIDALRASDGMSEIALVGPGELDDYSFARDVDLLLEEGEDDTENAMMAVESLGEDKNILMVTPDLPLLNPESINNFISHCPA